MRLLNQPISTPSRAYYTLGRCRVKSTLIISISKTKLINRGVICKYKRKSRVNNNIKVVEVKTQIVQFYHQQLPRSRMKSPLPTRPLSAILPRHEYYRISASSAAVHPDNPLHPTRSSNSFAATWFQFGWSIWWRQLQFSFSQAPWRRAFLV